MRTWVASRTLAVGGMILIPAMLAFAGFSGISLVVTGLPWLGLVVCLHLLAGNGRGIPSSDQKAKPLRGRVESVLSDRVILERTTTAILEDFVQGRLEDFEENTTRALSRLGSYLGADQCFLYRFNEETQMMENLVNWQVNPKKNPRIPETLPEAEARLLEKIFQSESELLENDLTQAQHPISFLQPWYQPKEKVKSAGGVLVQQGQKSLGYLGFYACAVSEWAEDERKLLNLVANLLSTIFVRQEAQNCQLQAMEALKATSKAKSEFLAKMSHEIRTPLNGVIGMTSLLEETHLEEEQNKLVNYIKISADHLLMVLNDILDFSKIEAGKMDIEEVPFNLPQAVQEIKAFNEGQAVEQGLQLAVEIDDMVPIEVVGDVVRVKQVLLNLVSNAIKFTGAGGVRVSVFPSSGGVKFTVVDTGVGISVEDQDRIFDQFAQADSSTTRSFGGTGLGLSICRQLVELMGGSIGVRSELNGGAEFWFELPLEPAFGQEPQSLWESSVDEDSRPADGLNILLAEDNPINQVYATKLLNRMGAKVAVAGNGKEAVAMVQQDFYDLVLMDCQMPEMDGYQATGEIRGLGGRFTELPIIALTAFAGSDDRGTCLASGMNDYLTKPVDRSEILEMLEQWAPSNTLVV